MNIKKHIRELSEGFGVKEFDNGIKRVIVLGKDGESIHDELLDLTFKVSEQTNLSTDSAYNFTRDALDVLSESESTKEDDLRDLSRNLEADVYTSELTSWLNESINHVSYMTQALEETNYVDGFVLLMQEQILAKTEAFDVVVDHLLDN